MSESSHKSRSKKRKQQSPDSSSTSSTESESESSTSRSNSPSPPAKKHRSDSKHKKGRKKKSDSRRSRKEKKRMDEDEKTERMRQAVEAVKKGLPAKDACKIFHVPRTSLDRIVRGQGPLIKPPKTALTKKEEQKFAQWAINMARSGFGRSKKEFLNAIKMYLDQLNEPTTRFKNGNLPVKTWYYGFLRRHPELRVKKNPTEAGRIRITYAKVESWSDSLEEFVAGSDDPDILSYPERIFKVCVVGFPLSSDEQFVLAPKSRGDVTIPNSEKKITTMCCMSADGTFTSPLVVLPGSRKTVKVEALFGGCMMEANMNGSLANDLFLAWLKGVFFKLLNVREVKHPVLLLVDSFSTYVSKQASNICLENGVLLYCLQSNAIDQLFFSSFNHNWDEAVSDFQANTPELTVTKDSFGLIFEPAYTKSCDPNLAKEYFAKSGLYPFVKSEVRNPNKMQPSGPSKLKIKTEFCTPSTLLPSAPSSSSLPRKSSSTLKLKSSSSRPKLSSSLFKSSSSRPKCSSSSLKSSSSLPQFSPPSFQSPSSLPQFSSSSFQPSSSLPQFSPPSFQPSSSLPQFSSSASHLTFTVPVPSPLTVLVVLEHILPEEVKLAFRTRLEEGFDPTDDYIYNIWKKYTLLLHGQSSASDDLPHNLSVLPSISADHSSSSSSMLYHTPTSTSLPYQLSTSADPPTDQLSASAVPHSSISSPDHPSTSAGHSDTFSKMANLIVQRLEQDVSVDKR